MLTRPHAGSLARSLEQMQSSPFRRSRRSPLGRELIYTSGTTGRPKGVWIALRPATARGTATQADLTLAQVLSLDDNVVYLHPAPLYHSAPLRYSLRVLDFGGQVVLMDRFDPKSSLAAIERYGITHSQWVPTMFQRMLNLSPEIRRAYDLISHRVAMHAAAPVPRTDETGDAGLVGRHPGRILTRGPNNRERRSSHPVNGGSIRGQWAVP